MPVILYVILYTSFKYFLMFAHLQLLTAYVEFTTGNYQNSVLFYLKVGKMSNSGTADCDAGDEECWLAVTYWYALSIFATGSKAKIKIISNHGNTL